MVYFSITIYALLNIIEMYDLKVPYNVNCIYSFKFSYVYSAFFQNQTHTIHISMLIIFIKYDIKMTKRYEVKVRLLSSLFPSQTVPLFKSYYCYHFLLYFSKESLWKELHLILFLNQCIILLTCFMPFSPNIIWRSFHICT